MRRTSIWWGGLGQPFALLALLCQMFSVVLAVPQVFAAQFVSGASVICHTVGPGEPKDDRAPGRHLPDCPACPVCLAAALVALPPTPPAVPPPRRQQTVSALPPARAGPAVATARIAAQPRGPPAPV